MIGLLQRVTQGRVEVQGRAVGEIQRGLLVLVGVERDDTEARADRLLQRLLGYRVFADEGGRMNLCLTDVKGGLLLIPQFTLAADTKKGMRPSFSLAADPDKGQRLFTYLCRRAREVYCPVETGLFGTDMEVGLVNDGPVTFWLNT